MKKLISLLLLCSGMTLGCAGNLEEGAQSGLDSETGQDAQAMCQEYSCHAGECPACPDASVACISGVCRYTLWRVAPEKSPAAVCPTAFCRVDSECAVACPSAPNPRCLPNRTCSYN